MRLYCRVACNRISAQQTIGEEAIFNMRHCVIILSCICVSLGSRATASAKPSREAIALYVDKCNSEKKTPHLTEKFGADFSNLDLHGIRLRGAVLDGADFSGSDLSEGSFYEVSCNEAIFSRTNLQGAGFYECSFDGAILENTNLEGAHIRSCSFKAVTFKLANLKEVDVRDSNLSNAKFDDVVFSGAFIVDSDLHGADFSQANLSGVRALGDDLSEADLSGADLRGVFYFRWGVTFRNANLSNVNFKGADLEGAEFTGATLTGANFSEANIKGAIFQDVQGIDSKTEKMLKRRAGRRVYRLKHGLSLVLSHFCWHLYLISLTALFCVFLTTLKTHYKKKLYISACFTNAIALIPFALLFLMGLLGDSPVRQLSGSMALWSLWVDLWPTLYLVVIPGIIGVAFVLFVCYLATHLSIKKIKKAPAFMLFMLLTLAHGALAFVLLRANFPDA